MTTIATDGRLIAADSIMHWNGTIEGPFRKLHRTDDAIIGCAGEYEATLEFVAWLRDGGDKPMLPDDIEALVLTADGVRYYGGRLVGFPVPVPAAIGSGSAIAKAAMLAGADPVPTRCGRWRSPACWTRAAGCRWFGGGVESAGTGS